MEGPYLGLEEERVDEEISSISPPPPQRCQKGPRIESPRRVAGHADSSPLPPGPPPDISAHDSRAGDVANLGLVAGLAAGVAKVDTWACNWRLFAASRCFLLGCDFVTGATAAASLSPPPSCHGRGRLGGGFPGHLSISL